MQNVNLALGEDMFVNLDGSFAFVNFYAIVYIFDVRILPSC